MLKMQKSEDSLCLRDEAKSHSEVASDSFVPNRTLEARRENGRQRTRISRDGKRAYIQGLEQRVKFLEDEVFRLQNVLICYRNERFDAIGEECESFAKNSTQNKNCSCKTFLGGEDSNTIDATKASLLETFNTTAWDRFEKHKEFLDSSFKSIINYLSPGYTERFWGDLSEEPIKDYSLICKYVSLQNKPNQVGEFETQHRFTEVDKMIASLKPSKDQYFLMKNAMRKQMALKQRYKEGIEHLLEAKAIFEKTNTAHILHLKLLLSSEVLRDSQILESKFRDCLKFKEDAFTEIWKIQTMKRKYKSDLSECPLLGKIATNVLKSDERVFETEFNHFFLTQE